MVLRGGRNSCKRHYNREMSEVTHELRGQRCAARRSFHPVGPVVTAPSLSSRNCLVMVHFHPKASMVLSGASDLRLLMM